MKRRLPTLAIGLVLLAVVAVDAYALAWIVRGPDPTNTDYAIDPNP